VPSSTTFGSWATMPLRSVVGAGNPAKQHFLNRIFVHLQLGGDPPIGKVQPHKCYLV
jgi:hypothetical protein